MKWRNSKLRWSIRILVVLIAIPGIFIGIRWGTGNYGTVVPGRIFRAAQPSPKLLATAIKRDGIKTVLNLRGANPDQSWYDREKTATLAAGATQLDFPMSSDQWLSREQSRTLLDILDSCEYPILIHCEWGAERTGLVAAICTLLKDGSTLEQANREFSVYYLFLPIKDGLVMRGHLDRYERWLAARDDTHSPSLFREWLTRSYEPGSPSREYWPCNPYPLKVVTRPRTEAIAFWGTTRCR
jgi:protein tyrosine phosphatase (PTP) superfamily phosphohydrolase (DUF442 family)